VRFDGKTVERLALDRGYEAHARIATLVDTVFAP